MLSEFSACTDWIINILDIQQVTFPWSGELKNNCSVVEKTRPYTQNVSVSAGDVGKIFLVSLAYGTYCVRASW